MVQVRDAVARSTRVDVIVPICGTELLAPNLQRMACMLGNGQVIVNFFLTGIILFVHWK